MRVKSESAFENGWEESAAAWIASVDQHEANRAVLLDPVMLSLCGNVTGQRVLDVGCGEGRFCRILRERGARPVGIDPTKTLLTVARQRDPDGEYHLISAESLPFEDGHFDQVISYLTLIDIPDFRRAIAEMVRVLRPGGALVIANLTSFSTATDLYWKKDDKGEKLYWALDNYMTERSKWEAWRGIRIRNWHRPMSAYMQAFLSHGLVLEAFDEPVPSPAQAAAAPQLADHGRKPDFLTMRWRKVRSRH